jgi:hypothetical protein
MIKIKNNKQNLLFFLTGICLLIASSFLVFFNKNNDFIANSTLNIVEVFDDSIVLLRGPFFYYLLKFLSIFLDISNSVYLLYITLPFFHFILFYKLLHNKKLIFIIIYISLIYFGQLNHLLKMGISQVLILSALLIENRIRLLLILLSIGTHLQSIVGLFTYFNRLNKFIIIFAIILSFIIGYIYRVQIELLLSGFEVYSAYNIYKIDAQDQYEFHSINIILLILYLIMLFKFRRISKDKVTLSIQSVINGSLILIFILFNNPVVSGRIADYCWILVLIYFSRLPLTRYNYYFMLFPFSLYALIWGLKFMHDAILN